MSPFSGLLTWCRPECKYRLKVAQQLWAQAKLFWPNVYTLWHLSSMLLNRCRRCSISYMFVSCSGHPTIFVLKLWLASMEQLDFFFRALATIFSIFTISLLYLPSHQQSFHEYTICIGTKAIIPYVTLMRRKPSFGSSCRCHAVISSDSWK